MIQDEMLKQLIREMIHKTPTNRPSAEAILKHSYFWPKDKIAKFFKEAHGFLNELSETKRLRLRLSAIEKSFTEFAELVGIYDWTELVPDRIKALPSFKYKISSDKSLLSLLSVIVISVSYSIF